MAVERENGLISVRHTFIRGEEFAEANLRYVERFVKFMLWSTGGFRIYVCGCDDIAAKLAEAYSATESAPSTSDSWTTCTRSHLR